MYRPLALGGEFGESVRLVPEDAIPAMGAITGAVAKDATMLVLPVGERVYEGRGQPPLAAGRQRHPLQEAFGHLGNGGSLGFADPRARLSFGYR